MGDYEQCAVAESARETCKPSCSKLLEAYEDCATRFAKNGPVEGKENCQYQYFDYWKCMDSCVAPKLWKKLK
jgi:ubiquinol-cytochrome c reductase subunit 6